MSVSVTHECLSPFGLLQQPHIGRLINNRNLCLTVLEAGRLRWRHWQIQCLVKVSWFIDSPFLSVSLHGRRDTGAPWALFYKVTNPFHEGSALMT